MKNPSRPYGALLCFTAIVLFDSVSPAHAELPNPVLNSVFPPGGQTGKTFELAVTGSSLVGVTRLTCNHPGISFKRRGNVRFQAAIDKNVPPGAYELRACTLSGLSSPRTFSVGTRPEVVEVEPNNTAAKVQPVSLNGVINGRIAKGGDIDWFRFSAKRGQRVVVECRAERIDSRLRPVLELYDARGERLAVNRGYFGVDPLISIPVPDDGEYLVKICDLVYSGSADHFYRLEIDTGPRVVFAVPSVLPRGKKSRVTIYGWNLKQSPTGRPSLSTRTARQTWHDRLIGNDFDRIEVDITPANKTRPESIAIRRRPPQIALDGFAYRYPGSRVPLLLGVTDAAVFREQKLASSSRTAATLSIPCEVSGQLVAGDERDWYAIDAKQGEVFWFEAFGQRIDSPVDLDLVILDSSGSKVLAHFRDEVRNPGGKRFPSNHLDPSGRWVAPADARYLIMLRNLAGGLNDDPRRVYRLAVHREVPDFQLVVVPRRDQPASLNVPRGGRVIADLLAFRKRGLTGSIRVTAKSLPKGISCPDVWLGPGVDRAPIVISADEKAAGFIGTLELKGFCNGAGSRVVHGASIIRAGLPIGSSRLTSGIPLAVSGRDPVRATADCHETRTHHLFGKLKVRHSPGSILDVAVHVDRADGSHQAPVNLIGVGLPSAIPNQTATIPAGQRKGHLSFYLPPNLPIGTYTIAVKVETTVPISPTSTKTRSVTVYTNPVTFEVKPAAFIVRADPYVPLRIGRGKITQIKYTARRMNGFIGKIHTELAAPEKVIGLRGRGVTFVGQTDSGAIQVIANEDAPLGRQRFLRLYAVGVVEDQPVFQGSCFLHLEIVK